MWYVDGNEVESIWLLTGIGLYYKLHGSHRPVTMKKSVIKRRKRVVPAGDGSPSMTNATSVSPEVRTIPLPQHSIPLPSRFQSHPPPIDFTGWRSNQSPFTTPQPSSTAEINNIRTSRKRSISSTTETTQDALPIDTSQSTQRNSISSILNPQARVHQQEIGISEPPVDPSLVSSQENRQSSHVLASDSSTVNSNPPDIMSSSHPSTPISSKASKRAQLLQEAEQMREMLRKKEMELAELE